MGERQEGTSRGRGCVVSIFLSFVPSLNEDKNDDENDDGDYEFAITTKTLRFISMLGRVIQPFI